jgi:hypothetical protein
MLNDKCIIPECYVDTRIANILGGDNSSFNHAKGCGQVANAMQHPKMIDSFALGIIDEDKFSGTKPKYFNEFTIIKKEDDNLILKKHHHKNHYLIIVRPVIEKWLLKDASAVDINLEEFNLSNSINSLIDLTKSKEIHNNSEFTRFIKKLKRENAPSITILKS